MLWYEMTQKLSETFLDSCLVVDEAFERAGHGNVPSALDPIRVDLMAKLIEETSYRELDVVLGTERFVIGQTLEDMMTDRYTARVLCLVDDYRPED